MTRILPSAALYFVTLFVFGFAFGALRVLLVVPIAGLLPSVLIELPFMLAIAYFAARFIVARQGLSSIAERLLMGLIAFVLLQAAESVLAGAMGPSAFEANVSDYWVLETPARIAGLIGQGISALLPLLFNSGKQHVR